MMATANRGINVRAHRERLKELGESLFCTNDLIEGPPTRRLLDFDCPRLRKCPFDLSTIDPKRSRTIGSGLDGNVWKVRIGEDDTPFAVKLFWVEEPDNPRMYHAASRECRNAAALQMIEAAVEDATSGSGPPIFVNPKPRGRKRSAEKNMAAFSDEVRQAGVSEGSRMTMQVTSMPRMRKCYGWTRIPTETIEGWIRKNERMSPFEYRDRKQGVDRRLESGRLYYAIVYEYLKEAENDKEAVKATADFLWRAGFGHMGPSPDRNWKNGVLIDLCDLIHMSERFRMMWPYNYRQRCIEEIRDEPCRCPSKKRKKRRREEPRVANAGKETDSLEKDNESSGMILG